MIVHHDISNITQIKNPVVTSGTFDGVHIGHQKIIERVNSLADQIQGESVMLTFWPHPRLVLYPDQHDLRLLTTLEEKKAILNDLGIDHFVIIPFTKKFSELSSDEFIRKIVVEAIQTKKLVIGYDHRFGKNREGSFEYLKEHAHIYGFTVEEISRQDVDDIGVSSTKIRQALMQGDVKTAAVFLGRNYRIAGSVKHGDRLGRTIGFPTANLHLAEPYKLIPANGVYAVYAYHQQQKYMAMLNIGFRPTVDGKQLRIETHLFDFDQEIYSEQIEIELIDKIRDEKKFDSLAQLKNQLGIDKQHCLGIFNNLKN